MIKSKLFILIGIILIAVIANSFTVLYTSCNSVNSMPAPIDYDQYESDWEKVDSLIKKGLPKSALELVEEIYLKSKEKNNYPQFIKATLYKVKLNADFQEEFIEKTISDLKQEIEESQIPAKQILHSITADLYWRYYKANRYKLLDRTRSPQIDYNDIGTWDMKTLVGEVIKHYQLSLTNPGELKDINLKDYDAILEVTKESKKYRPTLYDFLAHRAVDFYMNEESSLIKPAYTFEVTNKEYFSKALDFSKLKIESRDTLSLKFYAISILQDLIYFHLKDEEPTALVDVDLKRLQFIRNQSTLTIKDSLYLQALQNLEESTLAYPSSAEVSYLIAREYQRIGHKYNPHLSDQNKWLVKKAHEKCSEAIERFPDSDGAKNCKYLLNQIEKPELKIDIDDVVIPDKPFLSMVEYKNVDKIYCRIIQVNFEENREMVQNYRVKQNLIDKYFEMTPLHIWEQELPDDGDFQNHRTEIKIPQLSKGYYVLLFSTRAKLAPEESVVVYGSFWVSEIGYISQKHPQQGYRFYLLDRKRGIAIINGSAQVVFREYDYKSREHIYRDGNSYTSDAEGYFEIPPPEANNRSNSFYLDIRIGNDRLVTEEQFYNSGYYPMDEKIETRTWFFSDRAIYRPGQTLYYKGIVLEQNKDSYEPKTNFRTTIEFFDVNYQKISEQVLTTNEFGSFNGSFTAPSGVLYGQMTIKNETGSTTISVEEYKRPKFEVVFNPVQGSYRINEIVQVSGSARAYAGNTISGAQVKYRVVRHTSFPWRFDRYFNLRSNPSPSMEITNGFTNTDDEGTFYIEFEAIPDYSLGNSFKPLYRYMVYADVTDINGETQSTTTFVSVSSTALKINLGINEIVQRQELENFTIKTTNLNDEPVDAQGTIEIIKLKEPERLMRDRQSSYPDVFVLQEEEFIKDFPNDMYNNEGRIDKLEHEEVTLEIEFNTANDSVITLENIEEWKSGRYKVIARSTDVFGQEVEQKRFFTLFSEDEKAPPENSINWFYAIKKKAEPGDQAIFAIGTKDKNIHALYEIVKGNKVISKEWIKLNNEQRVIRVPVTEEMRGGLTVNVVFVKNNRSYLNSFNVEVPYSNKKLDFEFATFRDKLNPGQEEEWKIIIKGPQGDAQLAELLTTMYDASLDVFRELNWYFELYQSSYGRLSWRGTSTFNPDRLYTLHPSYKDRLTYPAIKNYDKLNWFGFNYFGWSPYRKGIADGLRLTGVEALPGQVQAEGQQFDEEMSKGDQTQEGEDLGQESIAATVGGGDFFEKKEEAFSGVQIRRDFRETAFFFPSIKTNEKGEAVISFTVPESLTKWKMLGLSHTKDLKTSMFNKEIISQKDLMIVPNAPRFFRQGDEMIFTAKIVNLSEEKLPGETSIQFIDTRTMQDITAILNPDLSTQTFEIDKKGNVIIEWPIEIPDNVDVISYRVMAKAGNFSDGEEKAIPVLSNRMLVTESVPLPVNGNETKSFKFDQLLKSGKGKSPSLKHHKLTLEFSSNPAWYAVQALPYIMESERESADNIFNRYYANSIASFLVESKPNVKSVFDIWKNFSPDVLLSNLQKNQELKSVLLQETPWVLDATNENEQKQRIALLFDLNRMTDELFASLRKLKQSQSPNGGWPWFKGMRESRNITQNIVAGFGHLKQLGIFDAAANQETKQMMSKAIRYLDQRILEDYNKLRESGAEIEENRLSYTQIQYLYARSYFMKDINLSKSHEAAFIFYREQAKEYWVEQNIYMKGMIALALNSMGEKSIPSEIVASIKEHALYSEEMGLYWRDNQGGYYWYEAPIETQALLIEAFDKISGDYKAVEQMKIWLLKQKQTQNWKTGKATAEAVYALLLRGSDWLDNSELAQIQMGSETIDPFTRDDTKVEAGTGYFKTSWLGGDVKPEMGNISVTNNNENIAWGAVYWQYFENLDKIEQQETPLELKKQLFIEKNTDEGPVIEPVTDEVNLSIGDKIKVRIEIRVDRNLEYVHMKDMRASAFEPVNVLSEYRYQGGLGYYESTLDASTNFYFNYLRKGTYVFEYPLIVSQKGEFSNGITTIQCLYAPEFTSHSEGVRVVVE